MWLVLKCSFKQKLLCGTNGASRSSVSSTFLVRAREKTAKSIMRPPFEHMETVSCGMTV